MSVIESCRRLKIQVRDYLADILPGLANAPFSESRNLPPPPGHGKHPQMIRHALLRRLQCTKQIPCRDKIKEIITYSFLPSTWRGQYTYVVIICWN